MRHLIKHGSMKLIGIDINIPILDDGTCILTPYAMFTLLGKARKPHNSFNKYPSFIEAKNLRPFIDKDVEKNMKAIEYTINDREFIGYDLKLLPLVCEVLMKANEAGVLKVGGQTTSGSNASRMYRGLVKLNALTNIETIVKGK